MNIVQEEKPNMPTELGLRCLEALDGSTPPLAANIIGCQKTKPRGGLHAGEAEIPARLQMQRRSG